MSLDDVTPTPVVEDEEQARQLAQKFLVASGREVVLTYDSPDPTTREDYDYPDLILWIFYFLREDGLDHCRVYVRELDGDCWFVDGDELDKEFLAKDQVAQGLLDKDDFDDEDLQERLARLAAQKAEELAAPPRVK